MVNKREEERREERKGNEGRKEGERGESDAAELRRTQPMGRQKGTHGAAEGGSWGRQREKRGATEEEKKRSRKKRLRIKILLMQILLLVSHRLCRVDGRDEIAWTNQYCDADGEGGNIDDGEEKP